MAPSPGFLRSSMSVLEFGSLRRVIAALEAQLNCLPEPPDLWEWTGLAVAELRTTEAADVEGECLLGNNLLPHPQLGDSIPLSTHSNAAVTCSSVCLLPLQVGKEYCKCRYLLRAWLCSVPAKWWTPVFNLGDWQGRSGINRTVNSTCRFWRMSRWFL